MWKPLVVNHRRFDRISLESILSDKIPAIVIRNFYDKKTCEIIANRIKNYSQNDFQNGKLRHIGPFLMSYITKKKKYFEDSKQSEKIFKMIFSGIEIPTTAIYECISQMLPNYSISLATEGHNRYAPFVIRIHEKGKSIPIHKDNVRYEGKEYKISDVDNQLSCVLHLQESESGGDLIMYKKQWKKEDEQFRNVNFGYSSNLLHSSDFYKISDISAGDLVIMNPNYYHEVTTITGNISRITLGMFLGVYRKNYNMIVWA